MTQVMPANLETLQLPQPGCAALLRGVFTPEEAAAFYAESETANYWSAFCCGYFEPGSVEDAKAELARREMPASLLCLERLGGVALAYRSDLTHMCIQTKSSPEFGPHRDSLPYEPLSFLIVASGQIDYRHGGAYFLSRHYLGKTVTAHAGDVLCLNNLIKRRKRPVHSGMNATGKRIIFDLAPKPLPVLPLLAKM